MKLRLVAAIVPGLFLCLSLVASPGCKKKEGGGAAVSKAPVFKLAWSEYPSWSVFAVASDLGLINGKAGEQGTLEKKWGVDVVLEPLTYEPCILQYEQGKVDALCVTNIDILVHAPRKSVAILPTSRSVGADALLVVGVAVPDKKLPPEEYKKAMQDAVSKLRRKDQKIYGLSLSVSEYTFDRNLELLGEDTKKYNFEAQPPDKAAKGMIDKEPDHTAIMVWNPFVMEVLKNNKEARALFDSSTIPEEIIDMVVVSDDSLKKDKGKEFAWCIAEVFYEMNKRLQDPDKAKADEVLKKIGEKFGKLSLKDMQTVKQQTRFYATPADGIKLFEDKELPKTMQFVSKFWIDKKQSPVKVGFGTEEKAKDAQLRFDPSFMQMIRDGK